MDGRLVVLLALSLAAAGCLGSGGDGTQSQAGPGSSGKAPPSDGDGGGTGDEDANESEPAPEDGSSEGNETSMDPGWPPLDEAVVRPGVRVHDGACSTNFLFRTPTNTTLYIGTAAHCIDENEVEDPVPVGGNVSLAAGRAHGVVVYNSYQEMRSHEEEFILENDLALVRIPDEFRGVTHPAVHHFGGPRGMTDAPSRGDEVVTFGNSSSRPGDALDPRRGVVEEQETWETDFYALPYPGIPGDSGAPVLTEDGDAVGVVSTLQLAPSVGANGATYLPRALDYLHAHANLTVELASWTGFDPGLAPAGVDE